MTEHHRKIPATRYGLIGLIGALEAIELEARRLASEQPDDPRFYMLRMTIETVDGYDARGYDPEAAE
jgi:hypothetical protein